jgi:predicted DNA-binding protein with PD1-like motif
MLPPMTGFRMSTTIYSRGHEMEYAVGRTGRIIAARLFEGEDLYESIHEIATAENIQSAAVLITGGFRRANVVVGPVQEKPKIVPDYRDFTGPGEVLGVGTIYCDDEGPKLHMHTAIGKADQVMVGCPRDGTKTFLILEVTIIEIEGLNARRKPDKDTDFNLLRFG